MPTKATPMPPIEDLKRQLNYNEITGVFTWRINKKGPARAGDRAGARHTGGYVTIGMNNINYLAHRLAWFYFWGELSVDDQIDHENLDRQDNRIINLRKATHGENSANTRAKSHNVSGLKGAHLDKRHGVYRARIFKDGKQIWLGNFKTAKEAHAEYCKAAIEMHGAFHRQK